jgi:hypothetical protein
MISIFTARLLTTHFNIILPSASRFPNIFISKIFSNCRMHFPIFVV